MTHPLTNRILVDLYQKTLAKQSQTFPVDFMRAAADWQLEQVLRFMEENGFGIRKILLLKDAMRPQQHQEDNND